ncbi:MAG: hypothetical protein MJ211_08265 [Bacteroidales bacterium]|nr:hypothetical protein [Bacteroidales bacterium]
MIGIFDMFNGRMLSLMSSFIDDKEKFQNDLSQMICQIRDCFLEFDVVDLLSMLGMKCYSLLKGGYYLDNEVCPEIVMEYAINFGLSVGDSKGKTPTLDVVNLLWQKLKNAIEYNSYLDLPLSNDEVSKDLLWQIHLNTINIRGEMYLVHLYEICEELVKFNSNNDLVINGEYKSFVDFLRKTYDDIVYQGSCKSFVVYTNDEFEQKILEDFSTNLGSNRNFMNGRFAGLFLNGFEYLDKPFIKYNAHYYLFSPLILKRNLLSLVSKRFNVSGKKRDAYVESKVLKLFERICPNVPFHSNVFYYDNGNRVETDIIGISDKYFYLIEVKASQQSLSNKVKFNGFVDRYKISVGDAVSQIVREEQYLNETESPIFYLQNNGSVCVKNKKLIKIIVTFQQYSMLMNDVDKIIEMGWVRKEYKDIWHISLGDLMVFADFCNDEDSLVSYIEMKQRVIDAKIQYCDELDVFGAFLDGKLENIIEENCIIGDNTDVFSERYESNSI